MKKPVEVPVFLITGFLDSGKTTFLRQILQEEGFSEEARSLLITCEEGEEEYDEYRLAELNIALTSVEDEESLTSEFLEQCQNFYNPEYVFIEYNGMWKVQTFLDLKLPDGWFINQIITTVDGSTFENYMNNMRSMMLDIFSSSEMIFFNRCSQDMPLNVFRRNIKAVNRRVQMVFDDENGDPIELPPEELPFDLKAEVIEIEDDDFGIWYLDAMEHPENYEGKTVSFTGRVYIANDFPNGCFVPGRHAMTCCVEDIRFIGFICKTKHIDKFKNNMWVKITATVKTEYFPAYQGEGPVLYLKHAKSTKKPEEELVYFN